MDKINQDFSYLKQQVGILKDKTSIKYKASTDKEYQDMVNWIKEECADSVFAFAGLFWFDSAEDAAGFLLRWSNYE